MLRAAGASAALSLGASEAVATSGERVEMPGGNANPNYIDPVFGKASVETGPCVGDGHDGLDTTPDCLGEFRPPIRPGYEVELHSDLPPLLLAVAQSGALDRDGVEAVNAAVEDGKVTESDGLPDGTVTVPGFGDQSLADVAGTLANMNGFHFRPTGLHVEPGDVVLWSAEAPDTGSVAAPPVDLERRIAGRRNASTRTGMAVDGSSFGYRSTGEPACVRLYIRTNANVGFIATVYAASGDRPV